MNAEHSDFMAEVNEKGEYTDAVVEAMTKALDTFKSTQTW